MHRCLLAAVLGLPCLVASGCAQKAAPDGHGLALEVAPLDLPGIDFACYDFTVTGPAGVVMRRGDPDVRWPADDDTVCSSRFGNGAGGDIAYVTTCDAQGGSAQNTVTLWVDGLYAHGADVGGWSDPCPDGCTLGFTCRENQDTPVTFDFTILRRANQGFFDVAVNFADVFCSAKLDCQPKLLIDPATGQRGPTAVFGFACTSGNKPNGTADVTRLYLDDLRIECGDPVTKTYYIDPSQGPGQVDPQDPGLFAIAHYVGKEQLPNLDKCYWNTAIGLDDETLADLGRLEDDCWLRGRGTAGSTAFGAGYTPSGTVYPVITWNVQLTSAAGAIICGNNGLNDLGSGVQTTYTDPAGERFDCGLTCASGAIDCPGRDVCGNNVPTLAGPVSVTQHDGDLVLDFGGEHYAFPMPDDVDAVGCCPSACCTAPGSGSGGSQGLAAQQQQQQQAARPEPFRPAAFQGGAR